MAPKLTTLAVYAALLCAHSLLVAADTCYSDEAGIDVDSDTCPHSCCDGDECGSKRYCRRVWIIVGSVLGAAAVCACLIAGATVYWCKKRGPCAKVQIIEVTTFQATPFNSDLEQVHHDEPPAMPAAAEKKDEDPKEADDHGTPAGYPHAPPM
ncbi:hypothetical protein DIPPA_08945 [Diplonema papillatum]|nr:hypothetical protein DIPPA_08945 [Diplonema papillatum]